MKKLYKYLISFDENRHDKFGFDAGRAESARFRLVAPIEDAEVKGIFPLKEFSCYWTERVSESKFEKMFRAVGNRSVITVEFEILDSVLRITSDEFPFELVERYYLPIEVDFRNYRLFQKDASNELLLFDANKFCITTRFKKYE